MAPQSSQASTWPPSAAVRHAMIALITRRSVAAHMSGVVAKIGLAVPTQNIASSISAGRRTRRRGPSPATRVYPGGVTSRDNRSSGLCVARIVWVATCV